MPTTETDRNAVMPGITVIKYPGANINRPDDPSIPFKLEINLSPPDFMRVAWVMLHGGSEEMIVRATTREVLEAFVETNAEIKTHPRLRYMRLYGPEGLIQEITPATVEAERKAARKAVTP